VVVSVHGSSALLRKRLGLATVAGAAVPWDDDEVVTAADYYHQITVWLLDATKDGESWYLIGVHPSVDPSLH